LFTAGLGITGLHNPEWKPTWLGNHPDGLFLAEIAEPPSVRADMCKCLLTIRSRKEGHAWIPATGQAVGYLRTRGGESSLQYGDRILLHAGFQRVTDNSNPFSFNYMKYLARKGIYHRVYAGPYDWRPASLPPSGYVFRVAFAVRDRLLNILRKNGMQGREFAVAAALLLGYVGEIDNSLRSDYAATGAMHILSVSGMHVGIIYLFLGFVLGFLGRSRWGRALHTLLMLFFIWFYALVTGLSPCVLRAAAMLSLPVIGKAAGRVTDMYNVMAASLFLILVLDPALVYDVGFLLSYLAVTGIVVIYRPVYDLYITSSWLPDKAWSLVAVSLAAQVSTLPLTLYVFHQFPNYFLITNLVVVPLSSVVIYAGILALLAGGVPVAGIVLAKVLVVLVRLLNTLIGLIGGWPGSVTRGIFLSFPEMLLLYAALVAVILFFTLRRAAWLYLFIACLIVVNLSFLATRAGRLHTSRFVVFQVRKQALCAFTHQDRALVLARDMGSEAGEEERRGVLMNAFDGWGIRKWGVAGWPGGAVDTGESGHVVKWSSGRVEKGSGEWRDGRQFPLAVRGRFLLANGLRVAMLSGPVPKGFRGQFSVDILILSGDPHTGLEAAVRVFRPGLIVSDATNSRWRERRWEGEAARLGVKFHSVATMGAFVKEF
ncbi:MAG TPA: ComEC/Rec2 family competence protein, partial [Bacteroidales bacterium]|nr:ComEC/Rec2 family competence protein [Bacteroidales bacterium]